MIDKIITQLEKRSSWKNALWLFMVCSVLATCIVTMFFGLIQLDPQAIMDSSNYYDSNTFYQYLDQQGSNGRQAYLVLHLIDYLFMASLALLLVLLSYILISKMNRSEKMLLLSLFPLIYLLNDFLENVCVDLSIIFYPRKLLILSHLAGYFTSMKMTFLYTSFAFISLLSVIVIINRISSRYRHRA